MKFAFANASLKIETLRIRRRFARVFRLVSLSLAHLVSKIPSGVSWIRENCTCEDAQCECWVTKRKKSRAIPVSNGHEIKDSQNTKIYD